MPPRTDRADRANWSAALAGLVLSSAVLAGCSPPVPDLIEPTGPVLPTSGRPDPALLVPGLEQAQPYGAEADIDRAAYQCAAEAIVADSRISDETVRAIASMDPDYADAPTDLPPGENSAIIEAFAGCLPGPDD